MLDRREELEENEYSFEDGVNEAVRRIRELSASQDYVVVSVSGPITSSDRNVGKSSLSARILQAFPSTQEIVFQTVSRISGITILMKRQLDALKEMQGSSKCLILLDAMGMCISDDQDPTLQERFRESQDREVQTTALEAGLPLSKIDLRILIYRPDRPVTEGEKNFADITIRNDLAKDKTNIV